MMMIADTPKEPNWLAAALGKAGAPAPPAVNSDRIKDMLGRALLQPGSLSAVEVQELAASVVGHLVNLKRD